MACGVDVEAEKGADEERKRGIRARTISKVFKFVCTAGIIACAFSKWSGFLSDSTIGEICIVWAVVYGLGAGTIDLNILFEKFMGGIK